MLPSGITTLVGDVLSIHPELAFTRVHVVPLFIDRHVSFLYLKLAKPPIRMMLPSGIATLL
jgi:hypothetical protein